MTTPTRTKRGRPPGRQRCKIQLFVKNAGKVRSLYSVITYREPMDVMRELQQLYSRNEGKKSWINS